jgi:hypothetical protein
MAEETPVTPAAESSSPASPQEGVASATPPSTTESPPVSGDAGQSKESLLDAVLKVVPATTESDVLAAKPVEQAVAPDTAESPIEDQAETEDHEDDEAPAPPETAPAVRKKINKLLKQRREMRSQIAALEGPAQLGSHIQAFVKEHDLSDKDLTSTLNIAALLKAGDYRGFYEAVAPFVRTAQEF